MGKEKRGEKREKIMVIGYVERMEEMVSVMFFSTNKEVVGAVTLHEDFIAAV